MFFNPRIVSLILAFSIAILTTAFLSLVPGVSYIALFVTLVISFSTSFLLFYFSMEFLVMKEVNEAYIILEKLKKKEFKITKKREVPTLSPIKKLNYEIYSYASKKQREIDHLKKLAIYRREFLADVSHELKTPIFAAQGYLHTLLDGAINDMEVRDRFLQKAAKSLDGLNDMVEDLITLSKMESGFITMNHKDFNIYQLTLDAFEQLEDQAHKKKIHLLLKENTPQSIFVNADPQRIMQVMVNLLENSIKYGNTGGQVIVSLEEEEKEILIRVEDDGPGIPPEHLDRIFERFYRVEKSRSKNKGGSGLGLAIVKHIIEAHDSRVDVKSKIKKGTSFSFKLKKTEMLPENQNSISIHLQNNSTKTESRTVLIEK